VAFLDALLGDWGAEAFSSKRAHRGRTHVSGPTEEKSWLEASVDMDACSMIDSDGNFCPPHVWPSAEVSPSDGCVRQPVNAWDKKHSDKRDVSLPALDLSRIITRDFQPCSSTSSLIVPEAEAGVRRKHGRGGRTRSGEGMGIRGGLPESESERPYFDSPVIGTHPGLVDGVGFSRPSRRDRPSAHVGTSDGNTTKSPSAATCESIPKFVVAPGDVAGVNVSGVGVGVRVRVGGSGMEVGVQTHFTAAMRHFCTPKFAQV
jgi:hypothetical protein